MEDGNTKKERDIILQGNNISSCNELYLYLCLHFDLCLHFHISFNFNEQVGVISFSFFDM